MGSKKLQRPSLSKRDDIVAPVKTLNQSDSAILVGTLVWAKHKDWPWWPGLVVTNANVGWSISKKKGSHCILWLGPNKTASRMPSNKLSDFLDPNLNGLMNQLEQLNGEEQENAIIEAFRGLMSQFQEENELNSNLSVQEMKSVALQTQIQREEINGRKQVVLDNTSYWFKRTVESLRSAGKEKGSSSSIPQIGPQEWITSEFAEFALSALNYPAKKAEEKSVPTPPPRKKQALSTSSSKRKMKLHDWETSSTIKRCSRPGDLRRKRSRSPLYKAPVSSPPDKKVALNYNHSGALNDQSVVGVFKMRNYLQFEQFLNLELPKLMEKEKERVSDGDIDLTIQTSELQKVQLVAWTRFCSLYQSGNIHIRVLSSRKSSPVMLVMKPTDVVVDDDTFDILDMKDKPDLSDVLKQLLAMLLEPPEETGLYAFLLCDGFYWRLIGHIRHCIPDGSTSPLLTPEDVALESLPTTSSSSGVKKKPRKTIDQAMLPEVILEECLLPEDGSV